MGDGAHGRQAGMRYCTVSHALGEYAHNTLVGWTDLPIYALRDARRRRTHAETHVETHTHTERERDG